MKLWNNGQKNITGVHPWVCVSNSAVTAVWNNLQVNHVFSPYPLYHLIQLALAVDYLWLYFVQHWISGLAFLVLLSSQCFIYLFINSSTYTSEKLTLWTSHGVLNTTPFSSQLLCVHFLVTSSFYCFYLSFTRPSSRQDWDHKLLYSSNVR